MIYLIILFVITTYLVASIPFGLIVSKKFAHKDIREYGSKNIGATNVTRILGKKLGFLTLILDAAKGAVMVILAKIIFKDAQYTSIIVAFTGFTAVIGHVFPIYLGFKGGKGVATTMAVILAINPLFGLITIMVWIVIFLATKISAAASLLSITFTTLSAIYIEVNLEQIILYLALLILVFLRHRENLIRLRDGEENKL